jgi:hypothetical protein
VNDLRLILRHIFFILLPPVSVTIKEVHASAHTATLPEYSRPCPKTSQGVLMRFSSHSSWMILLAGMSEHGWHEVDDILQDDSFDR